MANEDSTQATDSQNDPQQNDQEDQDPFEQKPPSSSSDSDSDSDSDYSDEYEEVGADTAEDAPLTYTRPGDEPPESDNTPEVNIKRFSQVLDSKRMRKKQEEEDESYVFHEDLFDFPKDPENWREEDLQELWADAPLEMTKPGWDPVWADEDDWDVVREEVKAGRDPPIAPFYLPYRKPYPAIPDNHHDISNPKAVVEELDRIEEFLKWVSYVFADGSTYEGTVWDDLAHGKGVYVAEQGLVRYEGEWLQNNMEGHGVVEVNIPDIEPIPGSKLEAKMRAEGKIIKRDFMSPEDREWLEMDIEDTVRLAGGRYEVPFYENDVWVQEFGQKPEKGRYRYAGEWKHGRMHGCGVYTVNERPIYGRFYFGELLEDSSECDDEVATMHSGLAEVAAAKARMFVNKPDGMVREERGPYDDPQHPYFYEEENVWTAPGFINQFYEIPDDWKLYVQEVDKEREMWLNSFYKAPLRIPMPAELEYLWSKDETPEFILINKEPEPDPEDPSKLIYKEDPLILHMPTGRLINYIDDEKYGIRLFWQPPLKDGEDVDPEKAQFLPLGFDEFYGREVTVEKDSILKRIILAVENACMPVFNKIEKWTEEKKKNSEMKLKLIEKELELIEAEICLEEAIEDMEEELKMREKEEQKKVEMGLQDEEDTSEIANQDEEDTSAIANQDEEDTTAIANQDEKVLAEKEEEEEQEEEEEDDITPSSFGSVTGDQDSTKNDQKGNKPGGAPFSTASLSFASCSLVSVVPSKLQLSFLSWKTARSPVRVIPPRSAECPSGLLETVDSVSFPQLPGRRGSLRATRQAHHQFRVRNYTNGRTSQLHSLSRILSHHSASVNPKRSLNRHTTPGDNWLHAAPGQELDSILSLHTPIYYLESYADTKVQ